MIKLINAEKSASKMVGTWIFIIDRLKDFVEFYPKVENLYKKDLKSKGWGG
jgi:hypothetical protein